MAMAEVLVGDAPWVDGDGTLADPREEPDDTPPVADRLIDPVDESMPDPPGVTVAG